MITEGKRLATDSARTCSAHAKVEEVYATHQKRTAHMHNMGTRDRRGHPAPKGTVLAVTGKHRVAYRFP